MQRVHHWKPESGVMQKMQMSSVSSNDRSRTYWTPTMERYFIDLMLDQLNRGNKLGHTFNKQAWADMLIEFNAKFGSQYDKDVLKGRYTNLWKQFNDVKILLGQSGFSWDETRQMVLADDYVWDAYTKAHPEFRPYRTKSFPNFNDICLIFGYTTADGRYSRSSHDVDFDDEVQGATLGEGFYNQVPSSSERLRTDWTPTMDKFFIELLLDQVGRGSKSCDTFTKQAWNDMLVSFNAKFGNQRGKRVLRHRYKKLSKYYIDAKALLSQSGFSWDETRQMITAADDVWDDYIKENPYARAYRKKELPNYSDLALIYENTYQYESQGQLVQPHDPENGIPETISGEKTVVQHRSTGERTRTYWTPAMDRYLVDLLLDQVLKGNKLGQTFITQAWTEMTTSFNTSFRSEYEKDVLKNRYKHLRKQLNDIKNLLKQDGFSWDESREMVTAEDSVWDAYTREHPGARGYRVKTVPSFHKLCVIFGEESFDGQYSRLTFNIDPNCELPMLITGEDENGQYSTTIDPSATEWTEQMDRHLVTQMLELVHGGNGIDWISDDSTWSPIIASFNENFGFQFDESILEGRYTFLMKQHDEIGCILSQAGFSWDETQQMVIAEDDVWEAYIKDHPEANAYRHKSLCIYNDLRKIRAFGILAGSIDEGQGSDMGERTCNGHEMEGLGTSRDDEYPLPELQATLQQRKRPVSDLIEAEEMDKMPRTENQLAAENYYVATVSETPKEQKYSVEGAIKALQAITDADDDLLLDACDLLEDERKAKTFLALDASLRKKWLLRKLRS